VESKKENRPPYWRVKKVIGNAYRLGVREGNTYMLGLVNAPSLFREAVNKAIEQKKK